MKFSKVLIPTLSITSATGILIPFVTSCGTNYGGIKVEQANWDEAVNYFSSVTTDSNLTIETGAKSSTSTMSSTVKVADYKEVLTSEGQSAYYKNADDVADTRCWDPDSKTWVETGGYGTPFRNIAPTVKTILTTAAFSEFQYKNGGYIYTSSVGTLIVAITKVNNSYRVKSITVKATTEIEGKTVTVTEFFNFSNYGTTTITDWPE